MSVPAHSPSSPSAPTWREHEAQLPADIVSLLERFVSPISARALVRSAIAKARRQPPVTDAAILREVEISTTILLPPSERGVASEPEDAADDETVVPVESEADLGAARMIAREAGKLVGLRGYAGQKLVTAVSELTRNIARYAGSGEIRLRIDTEGERVIVIAVDRGPGIPHLDEVLEGRYRSRTGLGRGICGVKKLADEFDIQTSDRGTRVEIAFRYGARR